MESNNHDHSAGLCSRISLFIARFCISAWIGAASLFVIVGVTEVTRGGFDSTTKDMLVALRFPAFYICGVLLIGTGWMGAFFAGNSVEFPIRRRLGSLVLLAIVLVLMAADYVWIYQPLLKMVTPPGGAKPAGFANYHEASKWINLVGLIMCLIATVLLNWPVRIRSAESQIIDPRNRRDD